MKKLQSKQFTVFLIIFSIILLGVIVALVIATKPMPVALLQNFGLSLLWEEGMMMNECAECHNSADFHSCETCHDEQRGSVELTNIPFSEIVRLTGDVPDPSFVKVHQVIPDQENLGTHITLLSFLEMHGVTDFETITFTTNDGGFTTIEYQYLDETAILVPYVDGVRFITETLHSSTWLKGIKQITIVGKEKPLTIDGEATSIGRLLLGDTMRLTVEGSDVMLSDDTGNISSALVANWVEGPRLLDLLKDPSPNGVSVKDANGNVTELSADEIQNAIIAIVRDEVTLVLPDRGRSAWPTQIIEIESN
ncbi:MAG: hypothetical protein SVP52_04500 [Chloroflexota bacterium]|nr:hypothetical protein [Chloroflexota bacterium]